MKLRALASFGSFALVAASAVSCSASSGTPTNGDGGSGNDASGSDANASSGNAGSSSGNNGDSGSGSRGSSSGTNGSSGSSGGGSAGGPDGGASSGGDAGSSLFPAGTICNETGHALTAPARLKHVIVFLFENENLPSVTGNAAAPYMNSIIGVCGSASQYLDNCFSDNLVSLPHYLALTSGSNCNTGLDGTGTGCITDDGDATAHRLTTTSIFGQVSSWKAYQESMPSACDLSSSGEYATKHNPPAYYSTLISCATDDVPIPAVTCNANARMTACGTPTNALTLDLANDTLPAFAFVTPNLLNDMHDGTVTQGDNWLYTYLPLVLASKAYLRGDVAISVLWDEQTTSSFGGTTPNFFVSPYITAGTVSAATINHFSVLRSWENALGIATYLGCASGSALGGGACPTGSTADVRSALGF
jgi:hypothetical protein